MWDGVPKELFLCNFPLLSFVAMGTDAIRSAEELFLCNYACIGRENEMTKECAAIQFI